MRATAAACTLLLACPLPAAAQRAVAERVAVAAGARITIHNVAGSVKVTAWPRDSVEVTGAVRETKTARFAVRTGDGGLSIGLWDASVSSMPPSHIEVRVPKRAAVTIRTGSAAIFVADVTGALDVSSVGGDIEIRGAPQSVAVESMTGGLVLDVRTASARAKTVTAAIRLHGTYDDLTATSVSGNILLENASVRRGSIEAVDGELRFVGVLRRDAELGFVTHSGAVEFLLPAASDATVRAVAFAGSFVSEFSERVRTSVSKVKGSEHVLTLGSGDAQLSVRSFRGRIVVRRR